MKTVEFKYIPEHKTIIIDAVFAIGKKFNCVDIMRYIAENEIQHQTFDWHPIAMYLDELNTKKMIVRSDVQNSEFTTYEVVKSK